MAFSLPSATEDSFAAIVEVTSNVYKQGWEWIEEGLVFGKGIKCQSCLQNLLGIIAGQCNVCEEVTFLIINRYTGCIDGNMLLRKVRWGARTYGCG